MVDKILLLGNMHQNFLTCGHDGSD